MVDGTASPDERTQLQRARRLDAADPLSAMRERFIVPEGEDGAPLIYLCGNSLGLQPRATAAHVQSELDGWARLGVEGHFTDPHQWFSYHERFESSAAAIVGARPGEVVVMNALTVNLHLLMVSFYRPVGERRRIVIEGGAFPSDRYAVASQARLHGLDPDDVVLELAPREGERTIREEDIEALLEREGDSVALVMLGGVNYYTGQLFDVARITRAGHRCGAVVGFDLAHAAGNAELALHDDGVDFAVFCTYKYLNSGPGGVGCAFVHERHAASPELVRLAGWWGNDPSSRFEMPDRFEPQRGAGGWQLSNAPILPMAALEASLAIFEEAGGMSALRERSVRLTRYLLERIDAITPARFEVITPREEERRGAQLSLLVDGDGEALHRRLIEAGVVCDFRRPNVIRVAPAPLYNTFEELHRFASILAAFAGG